MKKIILTILLLTQTVNANQSIRVSFGESLEPWVSPQGGILNDVLRTTLEKEGYKLSFSFDPYARRILSYKNNLVDVVSDINQSVINTDGLKGYFSETFYAYENYAISLESNHFDISTVKDLKKYSLLSWQGASKRLGPEYEKMTKDNDQYSETHDQKKQVLLLFNKRYNFIQIDKQIFDHYRNLLINEGKISKDVKYTMKPLFGKSKNGFLFRDKKLRDLFVSRLKLLKDDPRFKEILYFDELK